MFLYLYYNARTYTHAHARDMRTLSFKLQIYTKYLGLGKSFVKILHKLHKAVRVCNDGYTKVHLKIHCGANFFSPQLTL